VFVCVSIHVKPCREGGGRKPNPVSPFLSYLCMALHYACKCVDLHATSQKFDKKTRAINDTQSDKPVSKKENVVNDGSTHRPENVTKR